MFELIVIAVWGLFAIGAVVTVNVVERKQWQVERADLLNRLMARDYEQYAGAELKTKGLRQPVSVVPVDELVARIEEREAIEKYPAGMPV